MDISENSANELKEKKREDKLIKTIKKLKKTEKQLNELNRSINDITALFYEMEFNNGRGRSLTKRLTSKFPSFYILFKGNKGLKNSLLTIKGYKAIKKNNLFDTGYYLKNSRDVRLSGADPLLHYIYHGYKEGRNPHPKFNTRYYMEHYPDVVRANLNPLIHYALYGMKENRITGSDLILKDRGSEKSLLDVPGKDRKRILYVLHSGTGGTPNTNNDLMMHIEKYMDCFVLLSSAKEVTLGKFENNKFQELNSWKIKSKWSAKDFYNPEFRDIYLDVLKGLNIDLIHIRHMIKHTFDLPVVAFELGIPVIISFHDFYFVCPSYNLLDDKNQYCAGRCTEGSGRCRVSMPQLEDIPDLKKFVDIWRSEVSKIFSKTSAFVTTADIVKDIFINIYPELAEKEFLIIEHGRDFKSIEDTSQYYEIPDKDKVIKILMPGNLHNQKGPDLIKALKKIDKENRLEFHFMGNLARGLNKYGINHGPYHRDDFASKVREIRPSFIGIFSIWPETYCHTLSEAWNTGVPILTTRMGAQEERLNKNGGGWFINHLNPEDAYDEIIRISKSPEEYLKVAEQVSKINFRSTREMAEDYKNLYEKILNQ